MALCPVSSGSSCPAKRHSAFCTDWAKEAAIFCCFCPNSQIRHISFTDCLIFRQNLFKHFFVKKCKIRSQDDKRLQQDLILFPIYFFFPFLFLLSFLSFPFNSKRPVADSHGALAVESLWQYRTIRLRPSPDLLLQSCSSENLKYIQYSCVF